MSLIFFYVLVAFVLSAVSFVGYRRRNKDRGELLGDVAAVAAFVPVTVAFFWRLIFVGGVSVPAGGGDFASFLYPLYTFAADSIQQGVVPLWNPYLFSGSPFAANMQTGLFYPINLLAFVLARPFTYVTMEELAVIHFFLAACFTYLYIRSLGLSKVPSFVAGIIFAFGGYVTAHLGHLSMIAASVWLPLILLFFHRAVTRGSVRSAALAGAVFALSILAGHLQITLYFALALTLYWIWHLRFFWLRQNPPAARFVPPISWTHIVSLPVTGLIALGASAIQWLPSFELLQLSLRSELTYARSLEFSVSPTGLITLLVPRFFGDNPATHWGLKWSLVEVFGYVGILPLLLALVAIAGRRRHSSQVGFFAILAVLALLLSLGDYTVLHGWLYKFVPGFDKARSAGRFLLLFDFSLAVLAAVGMEQLRSTLRKRERQQYRPVAYIALAALAGSVFLASPIFYYALLTSQDKDPVIFQRIEQALAGVNLSVLFLAASVALLITSLRRFRWSRALQGASVLLIIVDLFSANAGFNPTTENLLAGFDHPQIVQFLKRSTHGPFRVDSATGAEESWQPDSALLNGVSDVMGAFDPMMLADYNLYWQSLGSRSSPAYDILNAKYVIARKDVQLDWEKFRPALTDAPGNLAVYENTKVLPRAVLVPTVEVVARDKMLARLGSAGFDPRQIALVEEPIDGLSSTNGDRFEGQALVTERTSPNVIAVRTESNHPSLLLISDNSYPGWTARVDGSESRVLRADYTFKAILVPAGTHEVKLEFKPRIFEIGMVISGLFWLFLVVLAARSLLAR